MDSYSAAADPLSLAEFAPDGFDRPSSFTNARSTDAGHWQKRNEAHHSSNTSEKMEVDHSSPIPPPLGGHLEEKASSSSKPSQPPQKRIPRPRNAFMIFRSAFWAEQKINRTVEHDHRHISRIVGHCWNRMSEMEKDKWRAKAAMEKDEHARKHPNYVFSPTPRAKRPVKRKVKRNGPEDLKRCEEVADLLLMGKQGEDLAAAIKAIKLPNLDGDDLPTSPLSYRSNSPLGDWFESDFQDPPFRSPLLPPSSLQTTPVATTPAMPSTISSPTVTVLHFQASAIQY